jgi:hypothetical protein
MAQWSAEEPARLAQSRAQAHDMPRRPVNPHE